MVLLFQGIAKVSQREITAANNRVRRSQFMHLPSHLFWHEFKILSFICLLILAIGGVLLLCERESIPRT